MNLTENFGTRVFSRREMQKRLPEKVFESLEQATRLGGNLDAAIAQAVAGAMRDWAIEQGATHFTHWFQPMTGITAGKLDAFLSPSSDGSGGAIVEFSSKSLFMGEPDASSFPSGGLRATFEARGYTAWDPTSPAFVKGHTLYIPTAFCSYTGEALDAKTPLLRSMEAVSREAVRFCRSVGLSDVSSVQANCGAEQEYFIIDRQAYEKRIDLKICGRTLLGARSPKGQQLSDHYFGRIRLRIAAFMEEVDRRLWELGVPAKTRHNEAAPAQHELAPLFESCNVACDHNQLIMEVLRQVAKEQGLACLMHEKPFDWVNGSGKHNNYSLCTDTGRNLFAPPKDGSEDALFLLSVCAFLRGVDLYPELLRLSAAGAGNDCRLGGFEAPPPIISVFLGDSLTDALHKAAGEEILAVHRGGVLNIGVSTSPELTQDDSDRNRTSPVAFTGNKFEFRMIGSSQSIALANTVLNTILADSFHAFALYFEQEGFSSQSVSRVIAETLTRHGRIVFNGNNYSAEWTEEARRRGLPVIADSVDAFGALEKPHCRELLGRFGVLTPAECDARYDIMLDGYNKTVEIEVAVLCQMVHQQILPAVEKYLGRVARSARDFEAAEGKRQAYLQTHLDELSGVLDEIGERLGALEQAVRTAPAGGKVEQAVWLRERVRPAAAHLRASCDAAEAMVDSEIWPIPSYTSMLHDL